MSTNSNSFLTHDTGLDSDAEHPLQTSSRVGSNTDRFHEPQEAPDDAQSSGCDQAPRGQPLQLGDSRDRSQRGAGAGWSWLLCGLGHLLLAELSGGGWREGRAGDGSALPLVAAHRDGPDVE